MRRFIPLCALLAGVLLAALPAAAQQNCAPRDHVSLRLMELYGEVRRGVGLEGSDSLVEIYTSDATGTLTIVVTNARGISCLVAAGRAWEMLDLLSAPEGDPL